MPEVPAAPLARAQNAFTDKRGATTAWAVCWTIGLAMLGGVAMDSTNAYTYKSQLQSVADASALAAALKIQNQSDARDAAVALAESNMPPGKHGAVIRREDIRFGKLDDTGSFVELPDGDPEIKVVNLVAGRDGVRGEPIPTWMMSLAGQEDWKVNVSSTAVAQMSLGGGGGGGGDDLLCSSANIISTGYIDTGGGNHLGRGVCVHGADGVRTGGNDLIEPGAHISAVDEGTITINWLAPGSDTEENIKHPADTVTPVLDAVADGLFDDYWAAIEATGIKMYGFGPYKNYYGPSLPKWLFKDTGRAYKVMPLDRTSPSQIDYTFQPGEVMSNGIYLWKGNVGFAGDVDFNNAAFFVTGNINFGGGANVSFNNVVFFAKGNIQASGDTMWGDPSNFCSTGEYTVFMIAEGTIGLGGWGSGANGMYGATVAAGGGLHPGGALRNGGGGLYVEVDNPWTSLGGDMDIRACDVQLSNFLESFELDDEDTGYETAGGTDPFLHINDGVVDLLQLVETAN
ncbi:pilus assembly protein TadG-related protein [Rhodovulum sp. DZ06]|uniref:pilus assembly protein TadG-related protein n=1 Tax=Rhodovulum sp. DZ06 TaxID=3425126 RepID=UPI003D32FA2B